MKHYECGHCLTNLGEFVEGGEEPRCPIHPNGIINLVNTDDD